MAPPAAAEELLDLGILKLGEKHKQHIHLMFIIKHALLPPYLPNPTKHPVTPCESVTRGLKGAATIAPMVPLQIAPKMDARLQDNCTHSCPSTLFEARDEMLTMV